MIYPVVLCGGAGTRLWPLSRKGFPKQFSRLTDPQKSLFEATLSRLQGPDFAEALVVTGPDFRFLVAEQMQAAGSKGRILLEPAARNTAPAILAAALHLAQSDPEALILVAPSDHVIPDTAAFQTAVRSGVPAAEAGRLVTFGITPTAPETGYGWLECEGPATTDPV
ncbi:mannose-1-phosphate guanylyltransferase/mannose-6-phosphate isomerase, partial [Falsigemmobacter intermedius]